MEGENHNFCVLQKLDLDLQERLFLTARREMIVKNIFYRLVFIEYNITIIKICKKCI